MAVAPVSNLAGTQQNRTAVGARPAARPALLPQRLAGDATRFKPREVAAPGALPAEPAKFDGPEDFKAYVAAVVAAGQLIKARAAQPHAALVAAEAAVKARDAEVGMDLALANAAAASAKAEATRQDAELAAQCDLAAKALDAARNPGRGRANRVRKDCDALHQQIATARAAVGQSQALLDGGDGTPAQRAAAYATIATQKHKLKGLEAQLVAKQAELGHEAGRTAPEGDAAVAAAQARLNELQQRRAHAAAEAGARQMQAADRAERAQEAYDEQLAPVRADLAKARAAYAPLKAKLDGCREQLLRADGLVTKTQRALWWARGLEVERYLSEQAAQLR
jgi:chromosome segregation ATPase